MTREDLERRRDVAKAEANRVREVFADAAEFVGSAIADGLRSGIVPEAEYRLLTNEQARAKVLGGPLASATSDGPGFILDGGILMPAPDVALAAEAEEAARAMAELDRNFADNTRDAR